MTNLINQGPQVTQTYQLGAGQSLDAGFVPQLVICASDQASPPLVSSGGAAASAPNPFAGDASATVDGNGLATLVSNFPLDIASVQQTTAWRFALSAGGAVVYTPWQTLVVGATGSGGGGGGGLTSTQVQAAVAAAMAAGGITPTAFQTAAASALVAGGITLDGMTHAILHATIDGNVTYQQNQALILAYNENRFTKLDTPLPPAVPTTRTITFFNQENQPIATTVDALVNGAVAGRTSVTFTNLPSAT